MPVNNQAIGQTSPKSGTYQRSVKRMQGVTLLIPTAATVTEVSNNRIVSLQEDSSGKQYAVIARTAYNGMIIVGWGVLEEALQSGGVSSIAPTPNTFVDGDTVTVLRNPMDVYMIDYDESNEPTSGIGTAYIDVQGRLTSVSGGSNLAVQGAVFDSIPGREMSNQLKDGCKFYQMLSPIKP
jgi:hypothetical protein